MAVDNDFRLATNRSVDAHCFSRSGGQSHEDTEVPRLVLELLASLEVSHCSRILSSSERICPKDQKKKNFFLLSFLTLPSRHLLLLTCGWQVFWLDQALEVI